MYFRNKILTFLLAVIFIIACSCNDRKSDSLVIHGTEPKPIVLDINTSFISILQDFFSKETEFELNGNFFKEYKADEDIDYYLVVSFADKVKSPFFKDLSASDSLLPEYRCIIDVPYKNCGNNPEYVRKETIKYNKRGYHTLCFQAFFTSASYLNDVFSDLSEEEIALIVFHELMHNYINQKNLKIPYQFNEAICDVAGYYFSLRYAEKKGRINTDCIVKNIEMAEIIYENINETIYKINNTQGNIDSLHSMCNNKNDTILNAACSLFQYRYGGTVNNAYLLMINSYSRYYFAIKDVFMNSDSIGSFMRIVNELPDNKNDCGVFLENYSRSSTKY